MNRQILFLAMLVLLPMMAWGNPIEDAEGQPVEDNNFYEELGAARVVYLGEQHKSKQDHEAQLEIIQQLHARGAELVVGLEMVQHPFQAVLDGYVAGELSEDDLRQGIEWDKRWRVDWEMYAPIFRFARQERIPMLALNTPTELTRSLGEQGGGALWGEHGVLPEEILLGPPAYRNALQTIFARHEGKAEAFFNFFLAQLVWDETMASRVASGLSTRPKATVVVLVGSGHVAYGYGIPSRVERRNPVPQRRVLFKKDPPFAGDGPAADFFFLSEEISPTAD